MTAQREPHAVAGPNVADLCFTARALAQTHPMTEASLQYRQHRFEIERLRQPVTEIADWASTALLVGYCLRRSEERWVQGDELAGPTSRDQASQDQVPGLFDDLEAGAVRVAEHLRVRDADRVTLLPASITVAALDRIIASELDKRSEHLREQMNGADWAELEDYIAWWVVHGYGVRVHETLKELPR